MIVAKIVEDILVIRRTDVVEDIFRRIYGRFKLGTVVQDPGCIRYFGFNIIQEEVYTVYIESDDKFSAIYCPQISCVRHRDRDASFNGVERLPFSSINSSIGW